MSLFALAAVQESNFKTCTRKAVIACLAHYHNRETGLCYPAQERISKETHLSISTVKRCIKSFQREGIITVVKKRGFEQTINRYVLNFDKFTPLDYDSQNESDGEYNQNTYPSPSPKCHHDTSLSVTMTPPKCHHDTSESVIECQKTVVSDPLIGRNHTYKKVTPAQNQNSDTSGKNNHYQNTTNPTQNSTPPNLDDLVTFATATIRNNHPELTNELVSDLFISTTVAEYFHFWSSASRPWIDKHHRDLSQDEKWQPHLLRHITPILGRQAEYQLRHPSPPQNSSKPFGQTHKPRSHPSHLTPNPTATNANLPQMPPRSAQD